jgi:RNA methyltransferase, TrmH family
MKFITSRDNAIYKELKHLATNAQARRKSASTILDGVHLCQSYLNSVGQPLWCVVNELSQNHPEIADLLKKANHQLILADALYQALSQVEHGVGIFFVIAIPTVQVHSEIIQTAVMLENLQDPGNLGSVLRSAAAAGIKQIFCSGETVSAWSPKVLRAGMGAHFLLEIIENADLPEILKNTRIPVLATSSHADRTVYQSDLNQDVMWLFGNEGHGISEQLMELATEKITIPHLGEIESLNVAACAAICFFEQVRQSLVA